MAYSERELIARMIQCEAGGEGDNGMKAVASVIMNRVNVPNTKKVINTVIIAATLIVLFLFMLLNASTIK